jgi:translation initiation factor eIF-2B subunit delta
MHPLIVRLGLLLTTPASNPVLRGTNARSIALLLTFKEIILTHTWPAREMHRVLPNYISPMIGFLDTCRPKGIAGGNVIRWLKSEINRIGTDESIRDEEGQKRLMEEAIDGFLRERIELADEVICDFAVEKIRDGDTIVTYAR